MWEGGLFTKAAHDLREMRPGFSHPSNSLLAFFSFVLWSKSCLNSCSALAAIRKCLSHCVCLALLCSSGVSSSAPSRWQRDDASSFLHCDILVFVRSLRLCVFLRAHLCVKWSKGLGQTGQRSTGWQARHMNHLSTELLVEWRRGNLDLRGGTWHLMVWLLCVNPGRKALKAST